MITILTIVLAVYILGVLFNAIFVYGYKKDCVWLDWKDYTLTIVCLILSWAVWIFMLITWIIFEIYNRLKK